MKRMTGFSALAAMLLAVGGCGQEQKSTVPTPTQTAPESVKPAPPALPPSPPAATVEKSEPPAGPAPAATPPKPAAAPAPAPPSAPTPAPAAKPAPAVVDSAGAPAPAAPAQPSAPPKQAAAAKPPATVSYDATNGRVVFDHQGHAARMECGGCHTTDPPVKIPLGKEKAHQLCKGCHQSQGAGPTQCGGCHKKA